MLSWLADCVAHNIVHPDRMRPYRPVEYSWSDQYDWKIQIVGHPADAGCHTVIGHLDAVASRVERLTPTAGARAGAPS